jgi:hypothetical protein
MIKTILLNPVLDGNLAGQTVTTLQQNNNNPLFLNLALIFMLLVVFIVVLRWILTAVSLNIKEHFENSNAQFQLGLQSLKSSIIDAIRSLQESHIHTMEVLSTNTLAVLSHVIDLKKESGNFPMDTKSAKYIFTIFMELESFKDTQIIVECINNKNISKIEEALSLCRVRFKTNIENDLAVLSKIDFLSGNLGIFLKNFLESDDFNDYISVVTQEIFTQYWNEKEVEQVRQNSYLKLFLFRQERVVKEQFRVEE